MASDQLFPHLISADCSASVQRCFIAVLTFWKFMSTQSSFTANWTRGGLWKQTCAHTQEMKSEIHSGRKPVPALWIMTQSTSSSYEWNGLKQLDSRSRSGAIKTRTPIVIVVMQHDERETSRQRNHHRGTEKSPKKKKKRLGISQNDCLEFHHTSTYRTSV